MNVKKAGAEMQAAREKLTAAEAQVVADTGAIASARARLEKAEEACRRADPDSSTFEKIVGEVGTSKARLSALENRVARSKSQAEEARASLKNAGALQMEAELEQLKEELAAVDAELIDYVRIAREGARARLKKLEDLLRRANSIDGALHDLRGTPIPAYIGPRHFNTTTSFVVPSTDRNLLQYLEPLVDDKEHGNRRGTTRGEQTQKAQADIFSAEAAIEMARPPAGREDGR